MLLSSCMSGSEGVKCGVPTTKEEREDDPRDFLGMNGGPSTDLPGCGTEEDTFTLNPVWCFTTGCSVVAVLLLIILNWQFTKEVRWILVFERFSVVKFLQQFKLRMIALAPLSPISLSWRPNSWSWVQWWRLAARASQPSLRIRLFPRLDSANAGNVKIISWLQSHLVCYG